MNEFELHSIHEHMQKQIKNAGGRIDKIYYCTSTDNDHPDRKPNPGMAYKAQRDFPSIDFDRAIIAGNNMSDMQFGRNAGIHTVFIKSTVRNVELPHPSI